MGHSNRYIIRQSAEECIQMKMDPRSAFGGCEAVRGVRPGRGGRRASAAVCACGSHSLISRDLHRTRTHAALALCLRSRKLLTDNKPTRFRVFSLFTNCALNQSEVYLIQTVYGYTGTMVSEGPLPVVWCMRDNQLVPHQVSGVKLQGAVTGAHIAAVSDFLRLVAGTPIILPHTALPENIDNDINQEKEDTSRRRKMSMQVEVPCVFLTESALQKAKIRSNLLEEKVTMFDKTTVSSSTARVLDSKASFFSSSNIIEITSDNFSSNLSIAQDEDNSRTLKETNCESPVQRITRIIDLDDFQIKETNEKECPLRLSRIIELDNDFQNKPVEEKEITQRITRIIEIDDDNSFSTITSNVESDKENVCHRITRIIELEKENSFPSMTRIIEMENEISNERRISLTNERETGGGLMDISEDVIVRSKPLSRSAPRFSVDSSCSENSYVNIECVKSLQDVKKEENLEGGVSPEQSPSFKHLRSRFPRKKTSVCSMGSSDCDDEVDVIFKSKPKSSHWVSLDWIPPPPKEDPVISQVVCDKNDFISKWIADQNVQDAGIVADERRRSLPPKANELYLQNMRRFSDGLQICKEDAASDCPVTVKSKWHEIVKRHLQLLKNDKGFRRQRGSWVRTARRLSGTNAPSKTLESSQVEAYTKLLAMP